MKDRVTFSETHMQARFEELARTVTLAIYNIQMNKSLCKDFDLLWANRKWRPLDILAY